VFRALREGEQADVLGSPGIELLHRPGEQSACDAALLELGTHGERAEEPDASPSGREVGADQLPIELRGERGDVGGALLAVDVVAIVPEILRIGNADEGAESETDNARGFRQVAFIERAYHRLARLRPIGSTRHHRTLPFSRAALY
jgi:hypothetical protein